MSLNLTQVSVHVLSTRIFAVIAGMIAFRHLDRPPMSTGIPYGGREAPEAYVAC